MAVSVSIKKRFKVSNGFGVIADITLDDEYPTNGEAIDTDSFGLKAVDMVIPSPAAGYVFEFDYANSKLKAYYCDYSASTDGAMIEAADKTSLENVVVRVMALGV